MAEEKELVVEERLVSPSKVTPILFVGLGGCGLKMVKRVKEHLLRRPDYEQRFKALAKFVAVDTNIHDLQEARDLMDETILLSDFEKQDYARMANGEQFLEPDDYFTQWVPHDYRFRAGDVAGAGQIRIESRLGLYYQIKHRDVLAKFRRQLEALKNHEHGHRSLDGTEIRIVICYSVAGGTGSGSHLPMAYLLRDIAMQLGKPRIFGAAVLPSVFEDKSGRNKDGIFANGYAALKETEHLMKLNAPDRINPVDAITFHYNPADPSRRSVSSAPFEFVYLIDRPERFAVEDVPGAAADGLYLQFFSPIFGHQAANYDNYTQWQRELVPLDFKEKHVQGFSTFFGSFGAAALLVPTDGLVDYSARRVALMMLRRNLVREIPGDTHFEDLRQSGEFDKVTIDIYGSEREISVKDLAELRGAGITQLARRALYLKRIQLLAKAEKGRGLVKTEFDHIEAHGRMLDEADQASLNQPYSSDTWRTRMVFVFEQLVGRIALTNPPEGQIRKNAIEAAQKLLQPVNASNDVNAVHRAFSDAKARLEKTMREGLVQQGGRKVPGFAYLIDEIFLTDIDGAGEVDWRAKRYAISTILSTPRFNDIAPRELPPEPDPGLAQNIKAPDPGVGTLDRVIGTAEAKEDAARDEHKAQVKAAVTDYYTKCMNWLVSLANVRYAEYLGQLKSALVNIEKALTSFDDDIETVDREECQRLADLLVRGSDLANRYELDAEALQMESKRRLWDFYFFDKWAQSRHFDMSSLELREMQARFFASEDDNLGRGIRRLRNILAAYQTYARQHIQPEIEGALDAKDPDRRDGYTLTKALRDEVIYRALFLSNEETIRAKGDEHIGRLLNEFKALPENERAKVAGIGPRDTTNREYLRDKIKRVVIERANLLCYVNESLTLQGGVRPCDEFVALYDKDLKNSDIYALAQEVGNGLQWVESDSPNPKEIIFYRSRMNLPMYAFARLAEMRSNYLELKRSTIRPKVLHIDKNWENTLPDLDPDAAIEFFDRLSLRRQVIGFAALMVAKSAMDELNAPIEPIIQHRSGASLRSRADSYWILRPVRDVKGEGEQTTAPGERVTAPPESGERYHHLGQSLREAIARLPKTLASNPVNYEPYQTLINRVHHGRAPQLLKHVIRQTFAWKTQHDSLRERYGVTNDSRQHARLDDLRQSYEQLADALSDLRRELLERRDEDSLDRIGMRTGLGNEEDDKEHEFIEQSIKLLNDFDERWTRLLNPNLADRVSPLFAKLFEKHEPTTPGTAASEG